MIPISHDFDLGRDETRIKDKRDAERQTHTVRVLLDRMYHEDPERRWELQLVADEVGMGKTFVALGLAYSVLAAMRSGIADAGIDGCAPRVMVVAPQNAALAQKWNREVQEFVRRCIPEGLAEESREWFRPRFVERIDELAQALRANDSPGVIVTHMGVLSGGRKLQHYNLKRRFLLGVLFRFWGNRFQHEARARLLKGAPEGWPSRSDELTAVNDDQWQVLPFASEEELLSALRAASSTETGREELEKILALCKEIAEPYVRARAERFVEVEKALNQLYRRVCFAGVAQALPLVIIDEAHNWKNGPRQKANGYAGFERQVGPLTRRLLLLTATPFQLRPQEMLELLRTGTVISPSASATESELRRRRLENHREKVIRPVLENAAVESRMLARAWSRLSRRSAHSLEPVWKSANFVSRRTELRELAHRAGAVDRPAIERVIDGAVVGTDPELRDILREALRLYTFNEDLSQELGALVIRHRRRTDHRLVRVGGEFSSADARCVQRSDRHVLHAAMGIDVQGDAELPHYLLMRCVSEMKGGKGRSSLGSALTGCYSTLLQSAEGRSVRSKLEGGGDGAVYLDLLLGMVGEAQDPEHPKVRAAVESVLAAWRAGEKSLLFCFRTHTARRLREILNKTIAEELGQRREAVLGGADALGRLRNRFTRRDGDLIVLGLDRILWSLRWAAWSNETALPELGLDDLRLKDVDLAELARLALRHGIDLREERLDRVFLHRATEHILAKRIAARRVRGGPLFDRIIRCMESPDWVQWPCGMQLTADSDAADDDHAEIAGLDERGIHAVYHVVEAEPAAVEVERLAEALVDRRTRAERQSQLSVFDAYAVAPSFWLGTNAESLLAGDPGARTARALARFHAHLLILTRNRGDLDWKERLTVLQSLRRALMRESVLLRLLPERGELDEQGWGELLVERFFTPLPGQVETLSDRLAVFVEDLQAADGRVYEPGTPRNAMYEATRLRETGFVVLVDGTTDNERRERVFAGFNSPLLPEVLICTSVGQEGIDLHRHCRNVIHYDLAWNPAVLEQRTGRVDRIGSKTFRERQGEASSMSFLDVGVPFLAGTYDERMYEELRIRAQTFEVLTGGDVAADNLEGSDVGEGADGQEEGIAFPALPAEMIADLRVRLHVWSEH